MVSGQVVSSGRRSVILAAIAAAYLLVMMDYSIINVALQTIQEDFDATNAGLQWVVSSYELLYAALLLPAGFLADRYGRNRVLLIGLGVFVVASGLMVLAQSTEQIIVLRVLMGIGGAVVPATTLAIIKHVFPPGRQARAMGVWSAVGGASVAVGPILGGFLVQSFAWWSIFLINVPIVVACMIALATATPESRGPAHGRLDLAGIVLAIVAVGLVTFGLIRGGETGAWAGLDATGTIALGVIALLVLVVVERRRVAPMLDVSLLCRRAFAVGTMSISLAYFALTGGTFLLVFYIQLIREQTPLQLGLSMLPVAIGAVAGSLVAENLVRRFGARATITAAMLILAAGFGGFAFADADTSQVWIEVAFAAAGLGMGLAMGTTTPLTMMSIPTAQAGAAAGLTNTIRGVTSIIGVAVLGSVYSLGYRARIAPILKQHAPTLPEDAEQSLSQTLTALSNAEDVDATTAAVVLGEAREAFVAAFQTGMWVAVAVLLTGLVLGVLLLCHAKKRPETHEARQLPGVGHRESSG
ncbi:MFS transporter [Brevibacterium luteolum]|nr:MFS transporter [Brevibacterium luteolum]